MDWRPLLDNAHYLEYLLPVAAGVLAPRVQGLLQGVRENRAASWPSADALVQSAGTKDGKHLIVEVSYRYYAQNEYRYGKYHRHFRKQAEAEAFAASVRGLSLPVRFREENPNESVMVERDLQMAGLVAGSLQVR